MGRSKALISIAIFSILAMGCGEKKRTQYVEVVRTRTIEVEKDCPVPTYTQIQEPQRPLGSMVTNGNHFVWVPNWLHNSPELKQQALEQIANTIPEADDRIRSDIKGPPPGYTVYIQDPGAFSFNGGLAVGLTDMISSISVAWRFPNTNVILMPALAHELRHAYTGDSQAGH